MSEPTISNVDEIYEERKKVLEDLVKAFKEAHNKTMRGETLLQKDSQELLMGSLVFLEAADNFIEAGERLSGQGYISKLYAIALIGYCTRMVTGAVVISQHFGVSESIIRAVHKAHTAPANKARKVASGKTERLAIAEPIIKAGRREAVSLKVICNRVNEALAAKGLRTLSDIKRYIREIESKGHTDNSSPN